MAWRKKSAYTRTAKRKRFREKGDPRDHESGKHECANDGKDERLHGHVDDWFGTAGISALHQEGRGVHDDSLNFWSRMVKTW